MHRLVAWSLVSFLLCASFGVSLDGASATEACRTACANHQCSMAMQSTCTMHQHQHQCAMQRRVPDQSSAAGLFVLLNQPALMPHADPAPVPIVAESLIAATTPTRPSVPRSAPWNPPKHAAAL